MRYGCYGVMVSMELWLLCRMAGTLTRKQPLSVCAMAELSVCAMGQLSVYAMAQLSVCTMAQNAWPLYFLLQCKTFLHFYNIYYNEYYSMLSVNVKHKPLLC